MSTIQFKDYYATLGVSRNADESTLRTAFRKMARKHHPDINPGDPQAEERFKEANEAYEVLADPEKRKLYDRYGEEWQRYRDAGYTGDEPAGQARSNADFGQWFTGQGAPGAGRTTTSRGTGGDFSDFFQTIFGPGGRRGGAEGFSRPMRRRGEDLEVAVTVPFDEAFRGTTRRLDLQTTDACPTCSGTGTVRDAYCPTCDGTGAIPKRKTIEVNVPAGVATGSRVRIAGQGGQGSGGGPSGDIYLVATVSSDVRFEREGDDLRTAVEIDLYTALLGGEAGVTTPTGQVALTIPAGTQNGKVFRLRGQGMTKLKGGGRGDLLARADIQLPTTLTRDEIQLFHQLRDMRGAKA